MQSLKNNAFKSWTPTADMIMESKHKRPEALDVPRFGTALRVSRVCYYYSTLNIF